VPVVAIRVRVAACAAEGQEIEYRLCVQNSSPAAAHHVLVRNPLPPNTRLVRATPPPTVCDSELQWPLGTLPGLTCKEIVLVLQAFGTDDVQNCARVQFEHGQCVCTRIARSIPPPVLPLPEPAQVLPPGPTLPPEQVLPPPGPKVLPAPPEKVTPAPAGEPKLELKIDGPRQQFLFVLATYTLRLSNPGTGPATNVLVTATLPAQTTFVSASEGGRHVADQVAWLAGTLEAGASRTFQVVLKAQAPGERCLQASALADRDLADRAQLCTIFRGAPALLLRVHDTKDPIPVGGQTSYVIVVESQGSLPVTNIQIKAIVPDEMEFVRAEGPTDYRKEERVKEGQPFVFAPYASLAVGTKITYEVFVKGVRSGDARFRMVLTADQLRAGGPVREEESTRIYAEPESADMGER
jgi:uncharacterized repeat protein (TIGR01451 family)